MSSQSSNYVEFPDPLSIPLPDDIPLPPEDTAISISSQTLKRTASPPPTTGDKINSLKRQKTTATPKEQHAETNVADREEELMAKMMGFTAFNSTKGKMVPGNQNVGAVRVVERRRYRQYMNRKGGFNRPLDKVA